MAVVGLEMHLSDAKARCSPTQQGCKSETLMNGVDQMASGLEFSYDAFLNVSSMTWLLPKFCPLVQSSTSWLPLLSSSVSSSSTAVDIRGLGHYVALILHPTCD